MYSTKTRRRWRSLRMISLSRHSLRTERTQADIEALVVQLARENSRWGDHRIAGELGKLAITLDPITVKNSFERHGIRPAPRCRRSTRRTFLNH